MHFELPLTLKSANISISLKNLAQVLVKIWTVAWPLAFPGGVVVFKWWNHRPSYGFAARIRAWFDRIGDYFRPHYAIYRSRREEDSYWRTAERGRRTLQASNANIIPEEVPLVRYFAPKLPPLYRDVKEEDPEAREYHLSPRVYCKWHRMVFRGPLHPTLKEAPEQIRLYSSRDRREIYRISRLATDEEVFRKKAPWTTRYATMWKRWLDAKGPDMAIVFQ
ncbi:hypothetical protein C8Q70DRAFT_953744 [Cubamyces menziesii]|uniref:Uncharacterized protein n=1 Tax=Trametes cubensis TaxID=1111947 RepID=A0AAD7TQI5_9APHY|nr:hypothetical protein C8Q70DRAFT_953744 [Cubamyces menziesii]KAJ8472780.1 hypothetical protein ONZ51_g8285 [Trametes cubensis]